MNTDDVNDVTGTYIELDSFHTLSENESSNSVLDNSENHSNLSQHMVTPRFF